ncbi:MAG TPA: tryptophan--tRNA ligase [Acidimicrobiales bacterium]|nr:tryptophan--tRNA ligase [Acidimicrobiales bacterium]
MSDTPRPRIFSGIKPTGHVHLGNYLGALKHWAREQHNADALYCVVDLHALTVEHDPAELRDQTRELCAVLLAVGLDPAVCTLFVQSHVPEHTELSWLMECTASFGEMQRMVQFKDKSEGRTSVRVGLLTYPALMAADILLYRTTHVPVGDDQRQHLELSRTLAQRFNHNYGDTFTVPEAVVPPIGARLMDLQNPAGKMGKSSDSPQGTIYLLDDAATVKRKVMRAVTDTDNEVRYDVAAKPGVSNLLSMLSACTDARPPEELAERYTQYGPLKGDTVEAVNALLDPIRTRYAELEADPGYVEKRYQEGADKARALAASTLAAAKHAIGLT